jgi:hypothetical protein
VKRNFDQRLEDENRDGRGRSAGAWPMGGIHFGRAGRAERNLIGHRSASTRLNAPKRVGYKKSAGQGRGKSGGGRPGVSTGAAKTTLNRFKLF